MMLKKSFYINKSPLSTDYLLKKIFTKYVYTKFLIFEFTNFSKIKIYTVENYLDSFYFAVKKKFKRLKLFSKTVGTFLKGELYIYKHSKLSYYFCFGIGFKRYLKKNIYKNIIILRTTSLEYGLTFLFKSIRGGFIGFSNKCVGYISKYFLFKLKGYLLRFKNYCLLSNSVCLPAFATGLRSFLPPAFVGYTIRFRKRKFTTKRFFFKRQKFFFGFSSIVLHRVLRNVCGFFMPFLVSGKLIRFKNYFNSFFSNINNFLL